MTIATTTLLALMGGDFLALSFFSAGHRLLSEGLDFLKAKLRKMCGFCQIKLQSIFASMDSAWKKEDLAFALQVDGARVFAVELDLVNSTPDLSVLSQAKRLRAEVFSIPEMKARFIAQRVWLRRVLGKELGCDPQRVPLFYDTDGRPRLQDVASHTSWSHSGDAIALVVDSHREVGLDLEYHRKKDYSRLAERFFHPDDIPLPDSDAFFRLWTRKEAHFKCCGGSLVTSLGLSARAFERLVCFDLVCPFLAPCSLCLVTKPG